MRGTTKSSFSIVAISDTFFSSANFFSSITSVSSGLTSTFSFSGGAASPLDLEDLDPSLSLSLLSESLSLLSLPLSLESSLLRSSLPRELSRSSLLLLESSDGREGCTGPVGAAGGAWFII